MLNFLLKNRYILLSSILFAIVSLSLIITSGYQNCQSGICSLYFSEWQMHDALWHISLAQLAFDVFPFRNPFHSGSLLSGYNYFIDLILYALTQLRISAMVGYFVILPISAVLLYLYTTWLYLKKVCTSKFERYLSIFFLYFGTSLTYLATLYSDQTLSGATLRGFPVVTSLHPASMLLNLPFAFSLPIIIYLLVFLKTDKKSIGLIILPTLIFLAFGLKFYAGIALVLLVILNTPLKLLPGRVLSMGLGVMAAYLLFYNGGTLGFPFVFDPLALTHVVIDDVHLFYNHALTLSRYYLYENITRLPLRLIAIESITILIFLLLNWGTRIASYFMLGTIKESDSLTKSMLLLSIILGCIPILFVQKGGWYNTMQFMYYSTFLLSLASARLLSAIHATSPKRALAISALIVLPLIPTTIEQLTYYTKPKNHVSSEEVAALSTLKYQPEGIVHVNRPWAKRALIPAFAEKEMYYLDADQLMLMLPSHEERLDLVRKYEGGSIHQIPADYYFIYKNEVASEDALTSLSRNPGLGTIFNNQIITIFARARPGVTIN